MTDLGPLLGGHSPEIRAVFEAARALVGETIPDADEQLDLPDRALVFGFGGAGNSRMRDLAIALIPHTRHVNVQLADVACRDGSPSNLREFCTAAVRGNLRFALLNRRRGWRRGRPGGVGGGG